MCKGQGDQKTKKATDTVSGVLNMPKLLEDLNDVTEQRKRLLKCFILEGASKDKLKILRADLAR